MSELTPWMRGALKAMRDARRPPSPSRQLRQFRQLEKAGRFVERINSLGQIVIACQCCGWDARRPSRSPAPMRRRATVYDRRRAVAHFLLYHRDRLPADFRADP